MYGRTDWRGHKGTQEHIVPYTGTSPRLTEGGIVVWTAVPRGIAVRCSIWCGIVFGTVMISERLSNDEDDDEVEDVEDTIWFFIFSLDSESELILTAFARLPPESLLSSLSSYLLAGHLHVHI